MRNLTKILLIIAASCIVVGGLIFVIVMGMLKWNFKALSTTEYETNVHDINDKFENIRIDTDTTNVVFLPSNDQTCKVECYEYQNQKHIASVQDGTLTITLNDTRKWYDYISVFNFGTPKITIYLPQDKYADLTINVSTGDVEISKDFSFATINITGSTSDVKCNASAERDIKIKVSTGDIIVDSITAQNVDLTVSTGVINATDVNCKNLLSKGNTGDIILKNVIATESFSISRTTGDVTFENCDAAQIKVNTDTGEVRGTLLTDKVFVCDSNTGDVNVPQTTTGGKCEITTDTGNIKIEIRE